MYSFVLPTRERHDVLVAAIKSVLRQTDADFELVVMDNASSPETKAAVDAFASPHIRYVRSDTRLAMTDNWELALAHVRGDYVNYLGDDDGPLPDAVEIAKAAHAVWPERVLMWKPLAYFWPGFIVEEYRNMAHFHAGDQIKIVDSRDFLRKIYTCEKRYYELPAIYDAFVPRSLIEAVKAKHGKYFLGRSPDVASGLMNCWMTKDFLFSSRPLAAHGVSHHSTGASFSFKPFSEGAKDTFKKELKGGAWDEQIHPMLRGDYVLEITVASELLHFRDRFLTSDPSIKVDMRGFLRWFAEAAPRFMESYDEVVGFILETAKANRVKFDRKSIAPVWQHIARGAFHPTVDPATNMLAYTFYADDRTIRDIADFTELAAAMSVRPQDVKIEQSAAEARWRQMLPNFLRRAPA